MVDLFDSLISRHAITAATHKCDDRLTEYSRASVSLIQQRFLCVMKISVKL